MKTKLVFVAVVFAALGSSAQTNSIIFPQLLSPTNSVLMTNAEFRTFSGSKIFFRNDNGYQSFHAADLNTNVLAALHITAAQLELKQQAMDADKKKYQEDVVAYQAELEREQQVAAQQRAEADKAEQQRLAALQSKVHSQTKDPGHGNVNENQQVGAK